MKSVDVSTLKSWMDKGEVFLIDVREPFEHASKNIPQANLIPMNSLDNCDLARFSGKKVVVHCKSGNRSSRACQKLSEMAPQLEIYNLQGGIEAWQTANLPIQSSGKEVISVDRQVQMTVGSLVLISSLLAYWLSPLFLLLTGFFGAGLIYAGVSGTCKMATMLSKMPWNRVACKQ